MSREAGRGRDLRDPWLSHRRFFTNLIDSSQGATRSGRNYSLTKNHAQEGSAVPMFRRYISGRIWSSMRDEFDCGFDGQFDLDELPGSKSTRVLHQSSIG
ncbi:hypothetical protein RHECIAT_CH0001114 [Rhizobium etli CIAT 652]|uniref:Uncharacterized protein n=1 Tax=Rhizobium etli (strain CIAT 652) TaxID=491916 RepID=B3PST1_RHIE6|nr:hypothetical protein RHECIAT_CH0001114 [Rhizobium etli CIAT 652]